MEFKMKRRTFLKGSVAVAAAGAGGICTKKGWAVPSPESMELESNESKTDLLAACPYCGVGCGTIIQTRNGRITKRGSRLFRYFRSCTREPNLLGNTICFVEVWPDHFDDLSALT